MIVYSDWETRRIVCEDCCFEEDNYYEVELGPNDVVQCTNCGAIVREK